MAKSPVNLCVSFEGIRAWARYACVVRGPAISESNLLQISIEWRDFPRGTVYNLWVTRRFKHVYEINLVATLPVAPGAFSTGPSQQYHAHLAAAIVLGMNGASEAARGRKDKFGD